MTTAPTASLAGASLRGRVTAVPAWLWLSGLVAISFVLRVSVSLSHVAPRIFPDEYIYASLGRSLADGTLTIRGEPAGFPALLEPLLAAPLWLLAGDDVELGYRLTQSLHALAVSLIVIPVYLLGRRLGLSAALALGCAAVSLALPALAFAAFVMADPVGLPLALGAVAAGTMALDRPTRLNQVTFVALAGLATLARVQYVVLPVAFLAASLVVSRGSVRSAVREQRLALGLLALPAVAVLAAGPARVLGYYRGVLDLGLDPVTIARWLANDAMLLAYAAGWVLVPAALVGLALGLARPRTRAEHAFAALTVAIATLLLIEAAVYASNGSERFQERYLMALLPLCPLLCCVGARRLRGRGARIAVAGLAGGLLIVAVVVPLSGYTALTGKIDSPTLWAAYWLEERLGTGTGSAMLAMLAMLLAGVAAATTLRPGVAAGATLCVAVVVLGATTTAAIDYDRAQSERTMLTFGDADPSWIDHARLGPVAVLQTPYSARAQISTQLFWNASLTEILRMKPSSEVDAYGSHLVSVAPDGTIDAGGRRVRGPLLVEEYTSYAVLEDARLARRTVNAALWVPDGAEPRLALLLAGRYFDGLLGAESSITVWSRASGRRTGVIELPLAMPANGPATVIDVVAPGLRRSVALQPGSRAVLRMPFDTTGSWTARLRSRSPFWVGDRLLAAQADTPRLVDTTNSN